LQIRGYAKTIETRRLAGAGGEGNEDIMSGGGGEVGIYGGVGGVVSVGVTTL
jgi:hypothetical protein